MAKQLIIPGRPSSSNTDIRMAASGDVIGQPVAVRPSMTLAFAVMSIWSLQEQNLTDSEREFEEQRKSFEKIPPLFLEPYKGLFVISRNGEILDADEDLDTLTSRFFSEHGDVPIYVDKIGGQLREVIDTHF